MCHFLLNLINPQRPCKIAKGEMYLHYIRNWWDLWETFSSSKESIRTPVRTKVLNHFVGGWLSIWAHAAFTTGTHLNLFKICLWDWVLLLSLPSHYFLNFFVVSPVLIHKHRDQVFSRSAWFEAFYLAFPNVLTIIRPYVPMLVQEGKRSYHTCI